MVILGLGSNVGDRLANLRQARRLLAQIPKLQLLDLSPLYLSDALLPDNAPDSWNQPYINLAIKCETSLQPQDLLHQLKNVEYTINRKPLKRHWGPRLVDIDILAWDNLILAEDNLQIPHSQLPKRPFALWPLADLAPFWVYPSPGPFQGKTAAEICTPWGSRFTGEAELHTRQILHRLDAPQLVGIINLTPDSFSDGGQLPNLQAVIHHAYHLASSGAEILDLGAEATNPDALPLDPEDEWDRLEPVLDALKAELPLMSITPKLSIDTRHPETAEKALRKGIDWINDPSGLENEKMRTLVAAFNRDCVVMHHLGIPSDRNTVLSYHEDPVEQVYRWAEQRLNDLEKCGLKREKIILDPGIGFGKTATQDLALIKNISRLHDFQTRLLIGHSRKRFQQIFTPKSPADRDIETQALSLFLAQQKVDYLRVHEVEGCARLLKVKAAVESS